MNTDLDELYYTTEEVQHEIKTLCNADLAKLMIIARSFARKRLKGTVIEPNDLFQQAIMKTLNGEKRWKKEIPIIKHLDRCMENISGHIVGKYETLNTESLSDCEYELESESDNPINRLSALDQINDMLDIFKDDEIARNLLLLKSQGLTAVEIQRELGIEKTQYESITKRIRRHFIQHLSVRRR